MIKTNQFDLNKGWQLSLSCTIMKKSIREQNTECVSATHTFYDVSALMWTFFFLSASENKGANSKYNLLQEQPRHTHTYNNVRPASSLHISSL